MKGMPLSPAPTKHRVPLLFYGSFLRGILALLLAGLVQQIASACSVPVFRYGLEHWKADPYRVLVAHRGGLNAEAQLMVRQLNDASGRANVVVQSADLGHEPDAE